ncbi:MAG: helix-turn-helix transcriptional regulator [Acidobacteriota bacterium]|nr:helix-turn-helix transcriptional regulator [Acidobacteriota bacterium]
MIPSPGGSWQTPLRKPPASSQSTRKVPYRLAGIYPSLSRQARRRPTACRRNGFAISRKIQKMSRKALALEEGSLDPALFRMERKGWLRLRWGTSENNRWAKFYRLTPTGYRQLAERAEGWAEFSTAVAKVMEPPRS